MKVNKYVIGIICGIVGAIINITFLLFAAGIDTKVYLSTGATWIAIGLLISACDFKINSFLKGIVISLLVSLPSLIYTFSSSLSGAIWITVNTTIVGAIIGFAIEKISNMIKTKR
ncbi:hypothetical protein UT300007_13420 [Clostridium sp. CTA-7]